MNYCAECDDFRPTHEVYRNETYSVRGKDVTVNARVLVCNVCNSSVSDAERDEETLRAVFEEYRKQYQS